jgi:tight adherence protein B
MDLSFIFLNLLGKTGVIITIGALIFVITFRHSTRLFDWIEDQTFGTRDYILTKFKLLFIDVDPQKVTWALLFLSFGLSSIVLIILMFMGHYASGFLLAIFFGFVGWKCPRYIIDAMVERRTKKYSEQLVDALNLLSNGIRAGLSFTQAIGMVVDELPNPIAQEFSYMLQRNRVGDSLEQCLENLVKRIPTEDNEMFVTSVNVVREVGGNLSDIFDTIAEVIRERVRLQQKVETAVSGVKIQAIILSCIPVAIFLIFSISDGAFFGKVVGSVLGVIALIVAFSLNIVGTFLMFRIMKIRV